MNVENYSERDHMARTYELASESQPYERVYPKVRNGRFVNAYTWHLQS